jgi:HK97 family phage major capsid protein
MKKQLLLALMACLAVILVAVTFDAAGAVLAVSPILAGLASSVKMKEKRTELENELLGILNKAKEEKRDFSDAETSRRSEIVNLIAELDTMIELRSREEIIEARVAGNVINKQNEANEQKEVRNYSLLSAMKSVVEGRQLEGLEREMHQEAEKEMRKSGIIPSGNLFVPSLIVGRRKLHEIAEKRTALLAGSGSGSYFVQTDVTGFIEPLYAKNVLTGLGAQLVSGLVGNVSIPKSGGATAAWEGESDSNADGTPTATPVTASPKRLGAYGTVSKTLIAQAGNYDVEKHVQNDIVAAINAALQVAAIEGGGSGEPTGILSNSSIGAEVGGTNGAAPTITNIINLEKLVAVGNADVGSLAYLTNPAVRAKLKKTAVDSGSGIMVWDLKSANELMGYKAGVTTAVPNDLTKGEGSALSAIIFGNFADLLMMQWAGFDIVLDPYTGAKTNQMNIVINSFWDVVIRNAASFAAMKDAITTD